MVRDLGFDGVFDTSNGFTLIELMIVVAIIGILAALSISRYETYEAKTHQAEAKLALGGVYAGEKAFYSEYSAYVPHLGGIGYAPEGFKRFYEVGYSGGGVWANSVTAFDYAAAGSNSRVFRTNIPSTWTTCVPSTHMVNHGNAPWNTNDPQQFTMHAAGQLRGDAATCDVWSISEMKRLTNTIIGY